MSKRSSGGEFTGSGCPVESYIQDARDLVPSEFEDKHGSGFLLLTAAGMKPSGGSTSTEVILLIEEEEGSERTAGVSVLAFPIRAREGSRGHLITAGRVSTNDVVIPDISVSRFHAFFKRADDGGFQLIDASSSNGTTVNGVSVATKETGAPSDLKNGDSVRFGQTEMTFLDAGRLRDFALKYA